MIVVDGKEYEWFGGDYIVGPHPVTGQPLGWHYRPGSPPQALSTEENERYEKLVADVFASTVVSGSPTVVATVVKSDGTVEVEIGGEEK